MLLELKVSGFGIIEDTTWKPTEGLNVITGETGAGKSLVVDAIGALLSGQRNEEDIRHGSEESRVEGIFCISVTKAELLQKLLSEKGLEADEDTILIMCDFRRQGRFTPRINRQAVSRSLLQEIGAHLVNIHTQGGHLSLLNKTRHLEFLDAYANTWELRYNFSAKASELYRAEHELRTLQKIEQDSSRQMELMKFQIDEIERAELQAGEEEKLEKELTILTSAEKLKAAAYQVYRIIYGDESILDSSSAVDKINEALPVLKQIIENDPSLQTQFDYMEGLQNNLVELAKDFRSYGENINYDPLRLEEIQTRRELIRTLKRKYGGSVDEILAYLMKAEKELEGLTNSDERCRQLGEEIEQIKEDTGILASQLSKKRVQAAQKLAVAVRKELQDLNMSQVKFEVSVTQEHTEEGIPFTDGKRYQFSADGVDIVEFIASTNPGEPLKPLSKIASTGEISRFMLALKVALAEADTIPVIIFDEIDIGVGGRSGEVIGKKLWNLSRNHQVICVTHLPQIAVFGDTHYSVSKKVVGARTVSNIEVLQGEARLKELAVMLAGQQHTVNSFNTAKELAQRAEVWKSSLIRI
jgi:DNA repair protein RecN (Recombination protein N)